MNPDLPVIMMTGLGSDFLNAAEKASPLACIAKPINFHYLHQIIELTAACHPGSR
jgi:DNA-binding NtrC family response regulator